jgi:hypothetical protein
MAHPQLGIALPDRSATHPFREFQARISRAPGDGFA